MQKRAVFRRGHRILDRCRKHQRRAKAAGTTIANGSVERLLPGYEKPIVCHYIRNAAYAQQDGHCLFCEEPIDHYHHIVPRHKGGGETLANGCELCTKHYDFVHKEATWANKLTTLKEGVNKKYNALSVLNQIIPFLMEYLDKETPYSIYATDGKSTKGFRAAKNVQKEHYADAYCIACSILDTDIKVSAPC